MTSHLLILFALLAGPVLSDAIIPASRKPVVGEKGMVVAVEPIATKIGADILKKGGNAIDGVVLKFEIKKIGRQKITERGIDGS